MYDRDASDCSLGGSLDLFDDDLVDEDETDLENAKLLTKTNVIDIGSSGRMTMEKESPVQNGSKHLAVSSHMSSAVTSDNNLQEAVLTCPFCSFSDTVLYRLQFHIEVEHSEGSSPAHQIPETSQGSAKMDSQQHQDLCSNPHTLNKSFSLTQDFQFVCPFCDLDLGDEHMLKSHVEIVHDDGIDSGGQVENNLRRPNIPPCLICGLTFCSNEEMQQHVEIHLHQERPLHFVSTSNHTTTPFGSSSLDWICPVCGQQLEDSIILSRHLELHFESDKPTGAHKPQLSDSGSRQDGSGPSSNRHSSHPKGKHSSNYKRQYERNLERAVMKGSISSTEFHELKSVMAHRDMKGLDDGNSKVEGLIEALLHFYRRNSRQSQRVMLCDPTDHFSSSYGDKGWGCGYRNFQMLLSCLKRHPSCSRKIFKDGDLKIPSITKLQQWIEWAWQQGFDVEGCRQLDGQLVNTEKWIGATEIVATLSALGIKCLLADFYTPSAADGTHPKLVTWVTNYFNSNANVKAPLYLQHQGHSRSIIGVEQERDISRLLLFDPSSSTNHMTSLVSGNLTWKQMSTFRRNLSGFRAKQYQIVAVVGLLEEADYEASKTLRSTRVS